MASRLDQWRKRGVRVWRDGRVTLAILTSLMTTAALGKPAQAPPVAALPTTAPAAANVQTVEVAIVHVPGISGAQRKDTRFVQGLVAGLEQAGQQAAQAPAKVVATRIYDWRRGRGAIQALRGTELNKQLAGELSSELQLLRRDHPDAKLVLTCHSGGAGIAAWALESLPDGESIDAWLLTAAALSPGYDLSRALSRTKSAVSLVSPKDTILLVAGTRSFGTMDGPRVAASGQAGFDWPEAADAEQYAKLRESWYDPAFEPTGHLGDHEGMLRTAFAQQHVTPLLRAMLGSPAENVMKLEPLRNAPAVAE